VREDCIVVVVVVAVFIVIALHAAQSLCACIMY